MESEALAQARERRNAVSPPTEAAAADSAAARAALFFAALCLTLFTLSPFHDLRAEVPTDPVTGQEVWTYFAFLAVAIAGVALARAYASRAFRALGRPVYALLVLWIGFTALLSYDPMLSLKRAVLSLLVMATAATLPLLPRGRGEMADWLAGVVGLVIVVSYFGVLFLPDVAIHSLADSLEPDLVGDWRGVFAHKNVASPVFGFFAYIGIYLFRSGRRPQGVAIAAASLIFLVFTHGKTSSALWAPVALLGLAVVRWRAGWIWSAIALAPPLVMNALGFGAQMFAPLAALSAALPFDSSFTGRSDLWRFAAGKMMERLWTGRGFDSFWDDPSLHDNAEVGWVAGAAHAHNGYVDVMLAMGAVGLVLTVAAFVVQPLADLRAVARRGVDPALTALCAQIWLYGVWVSALETFLYDRANPVWVLFLFAAFTLRYLATFPLAE